MNGAAVSPPEWEIAVRLLVATVIGGTLGLQREQRERDCEVKGLTTAASLWVAAAIGVACGLGLWAAPLVAGAIALVSLAVLHPLSKRIGDG